MALPELRAGGEIRARQKSNGCNQRLVAGGNVRDQAMEYRDGPRRLIRLPRWR